MRKMIFVIGIQGSGKSTFIEKNYADHKKFHVMDLFQESMARFGTLQPVLDGFRVEDNDAFIELYNEIPWEAFMAFEDDKTVVVECPVVSEGTSPFMDLIYQAKDLGIETQVIFLTVEPAEAIQRVREAGSAYRSSAQIWEEQLDALEFLLDHCKRNKAGHLG
ncbi:AAA family ATPase [Mongoliitalea daihaiensis]|uniref:AAA family ATPase n=1 Tax=Mongoliitalea daihaiensis TaxID=2782006 RepID=UPI001F2E56E7|nr:AAA family ATPase [Mongoliitalea daihaiensis]UJP65461.1 AAA family ATPase [Mongoliitalea daihaiensis]